MRLRKRAKPKEVVTQSTLDNAFDRRTFVIGTAMGGLGVLLAARMGYIAIAENEKYELESESNRVNLSLIPPRRGWILDRNGAPLASNRADFRVDIIPDRTPDTEATIAALTKILNLDENQAADIRKQVSDGPGYQPVEIASGITYDEFAAVSVRLPDLPGVVPQRGFSRFYPTGPSVGHLIGYVGTANAEEYAEQDRNPLLVTPGYKIGKDGLEKQYEQELRGVPGARRVEVTASGRIVRELETREDIQGDPIRLTIDGPLQDYAARRIGLESGSVVVMDCETGDLLCMASMPSFDPNSFSQGIGRVEYSMLRADERKLKQILVNLMTNAIKFTNSGGTVTLRAWSRPDSGFVLQVEDTGIGIAPDDIPKALSQFGQVDSALNRKYEGTGLGLPLTKALVEQHGGALDLQSEVGVGTIVTVRLPAARILYSSYDRNASDTDEAQDAGGMAG